VVLDGLFRRVFHEGNVLVRRRVKDVLRAVGLSERAEPHFVADIRDLRAHVQVRMEIPELSEEEIEIILVYVDQNEGLRRPSRDLPGNLASDGPPGAGYQHALSGDETAYLLRIEDMLIARK